MKTRLRSIAKRFMRNQRGFTLAEAVVGLSVILIAATGSAGLFVHAIQNSAETKHVTAATYIARSHMEEIKNADFGMITTLFPDGAPVAVTEPSLPSGSTWTATYPDGTGIDPLTVVVTVTWPTSKNSYTYGTQSVQLTTQVTLP